MAEMIMANKDNLIKKPAVILTEALIEEFLVYKIREGMSRSTILTYNKGLEDLYAYLPGDKEITKERLKGWERFLLENGYKDNTIATRIASVNTLLDMLGRKDIRITYRFGQAPAEPAEEITQEEYAAMLAVTRGGQSQKTHLLIKTFAETGIKPGEINKITVEAMARRMIIQKNGKRCILPERYCNEVLLYALQNNIKRGPVFITKSGRPIDRSNITHMLNAAASDAGINYRKGTPRVLAKFARNPRYDNKSRGGLANV